MKKVLALAVVFLLFGGTVYAADTMRIFVNNREIKTDVPAQIIGGRTVVPLRAVSEAFGADVQWDGVKREVRITKQPSGPVTTKEWVTAAAYNALFVYYSLMDSVIQTLGTADISQNLTLYYMKLSGNPDTELLDRSYKVLDSLDRVVNSDDYKNFIQQVLPSTNITDTGIIKEMEDTQSKLRYFAQENREIKDQIKKYYETGKLQDGKIVVENNKKLLLEIMDYQDSIKEKRDKYSKLMSDYIQKLSTK